MILKPFCATTRTKRLNVDPGAVKRARASRGSPSPRPANEGRLRSPTGRRRRRRRPTVLLPDPQRVRLPSAILIRPQKADAMALWPGETPGGKMATSNAGRNHNGQQ